MILTTVLPDGSLGHPHTPDLTIWQKVHDALGSVFYATDRVKIIVKLSDHPIPDISVEPCTEPECSRENVHIFKVDLEDV